MFDSTSRLSHKPLVTIFVLIVNLGLGLATLAMSSDLVDNLVLNYNTKSSQPLACLTSPFIHTSLIHLAGNLVFLGLFCAFIEGKLGPGPFLAVLIAVCFISSMGEKTVMGAQFFKKKRGGNYQQYSSTTSGAAAVNTNLTEKQAEQSFNQRRQSFEKISGSVGASTAIFGLMAVCLAWAPNSSFRIGSPPKPMLLPLVVVVGAYVCWDLLKWGLSGFEKGGLPIHLVGLVPGFVIGVICVRLDLVSVDGSFQPSDLDVVPTAVPDVPVETPAERRAKAKQLRREQREAARAKQKLFNEAAAVVSAPEKKVTRKVRIDPIIQEAQRAIGSGTPIEAVKMLENITNEDLLTQLPLSDYVTLVQQLTERKRWPAVILALKKSIVGHPEDATERQLKLARLFMGMKKYEDCESALASIKRKSLTPEQDREYKQFVVQIRQISD
ncbi:MAG: rhomboid family intramembrane serine protease [Planctomycetota bacterium]